jgi:hypothetical protein
MAGSKASILIPAIKAKPKATLARRDAGGWNRPQNEKPSNTDAILGRRRPAPHTD